MDMDNGRFDMEERLHSSIIRQKSKVPRARYQQRADCLEYPNDHRNGALKSSAGPYHGTSTTCRHLEPSDSKIWQSLLGERVCISGVKQGVLRYYGRTAFAQGYWCGVELDEPVGKNNGTVNGVVYFHCRPNHGIFAPVGKVSRLNDLNTDLKVDSKSYARSLNVQDESFVCSSWNYNVKCLEQSRRFIKSSSSDPTSIRATLRSVVPPHKSESFSHDRRSITEQRKRHSLSAERDMSFEVAGGALGRERVSESSSTSILTKYGYGAKHQFASSSEACSADERFSASRTESDVPKYEKVPPLYSGSADLFLQTPTNSGEVSPAFLEVKHLNDSPPFDYKLPEDYLNTCQAPDYTEPADDDDDQMSVDFDESLGILTPSQMKDFTLCPDLPTSYSDLRGMDFPSSESFDDINDLPEDEQVHDVSVKYLSESTSARTLEVARQKSPCFVKDVDMKVENVVSNADKFFYSISEKDIASRSYLTESEVSCKVSAQPPNLNNLSAMSSLSSGKAAKKELPEKRNLGLEDCDPTLSSNSEVAVEHYSIMTSERAKTGDDNTSDSGRSKVVLRHYPDVEVVARKNYDTDSSRDSLLQVESEGTTILKEKLTVSWEDCVSQNSECMLTNERPESVYTVASSDTGFQEDTEMDAETGMAASIESTDSTKRFSTTSRDSCIVTEETDGYKIAESNSTSGYSTGLSDSCCNDRPEDDMSNKPLTDEEILDSVGPCDSEDGFSFHENSLSKDAEMGTAETSDVTAETALCLDSISDAICETMVEDVTLTDIHELLSPEDNQNVLDDKENKEEDVDKSNRDGGSESNSVKMSDKTTSSVSSPKSTPEKKLNVNNRTRTDAQRNQRSVAKTAKRTCDEDDKKKQLAKPPKKNVMSKIKAMIEATSCKTVTKPKSENECPPKRAASAPKKSRWEAVTSKIAASLAEEKTKPKAKREVRSRVDTNLTSARQQVAVCRSPKLDRRDGSMSPLSVSSRRPLSEKNSAPNSVKEGRSSRVTSREPKHGTKSPRSSGKACITSRSNSPVAASESSTSVSLTSHNSKSKIAQWKGSSSTVESSTAANPVKRQNAAPPSKPLSQTTRATNQRTVARKPATVPRITLTVPNGSRMRSRSPAARPERITSRKEQPGVRGSHATKGPVRPPMWLSKAELTQEIQRLGTLCEARTKELNRLKMETKHVSTGFDAFASLFRYMVEDLNALSIPQLSKDLEKTLKQLELTKQDLAYYEREVEELKAHHCQELNDLSNKLFEVYQSEVSELNAKHTEEINHLKNDHQIQKEHLIASFTASSDEVIALHKQQIASLEQEILKEREVNSSHKEEIIRLENEHRKQMEELSADFHAASEEAKVHHEKVVSALEKELSHQRAELESYQQRELKDLEEKHAESIRVLKEHIDQLQKKCAELKLHSLGMEDAMQKDIDSKLQWVAAQKIDLDKEVESLKAVLEMKNKELHSLRVQNLEMQKQLEDLPLLREKIKMYQARAEDLEALMVEKTKIERKLSTENQQMRDTYEKEAKVNRRLSMENEELQWRLRQAENSLLSGSFSEVPEYPEENPTSPTKSPVSQAMSRSVFFTYVDANDCTPDSPRTQYKKIMPGFSAGYKTSPAKSSRTPPAPSPQRTKSHSEPPNPPASLCNTPKRAGKQSLSRVKSAQKKQRSCTESSQTVMEQTEISTPSMASSVSSESSIFEHKEKLLEEHKEQIIHSLKILKQQRIVEGEELCSLEKKWCSDDLKICTELPNLETADLSRSAEFSDPKTYYHMTFPFIKEAGDTEEGARSIRSSPSGAMNRTKHSMSEGNISFSIDSRGKTTPSVNTLSQKMQSTDTNKETVDIEAQSHWRTI